MSDTTMSDELVQGIRVAARDGTMVKVVVEAIVGDWAIHLRVRELKAIGPGYTITHVASGLALWHVEHLNSAVKVAQWMDSQHTLPTDLDGVRGWWESLDPKVKGKLIFDLSAIAPRLTVDLS